MTSKKNRPLIAELAPLPYQALDAKGNIITVNQLWLDTLGYKRKEAIGQWFGHFIAPDQIKRFRGLYARFKTSGRAQNIEYTLKHKDGSHIHVLSNGTAEYDKAGIFIHTHCFFTNITEEKELEDKIRQSENSYRLLADNCADVIWELDSSFRTSYISPSVKRLLGYSQEEAMRLPPEKLLSPKSLTIMNEAVKRRLETEKKGKKDRRIKRWELEFIKKEGSTIWVEVVTKPLYDQKGQFTGILETLRDIGDWKEALKNLESEKFKLKEFFENLPLLAYNVGLDGKIIDCNHLAVKTLGYKSKKGLIGKSLISSVYSPSSREKAKKLLKKWKKTGKLQNEEIQIITKQGKILDVLLNVDAIYDEEGSTLFSISTHLDISEKKRTENRIQDEKERAQKYLDIAGVILLALNKQGQITLINQQGCKILGYKAGEMVGKNWLDHYIPAKARKEVKRVFSLLMKGEIESVEYFENPVLNKKGEERYISWHHSCINDEKGNIHGTLSSGEDITDRMLAENALKENEARMRGILQAAPVGIGLVTDRIIQFINDNFLEMTGYSQSELVGKSARVIYPDEKEFQRVGQVKYAEIKEKGIGAIETRFKRKDGSIIDVLLSSCPVDRNDLTKGVIFSALDITDRKKVEEALTESEQNFRDLAENLLDGIAIADENVNHIYVNHKFSKITGYNKDELLHMTGWDITRPEDFAILKERMKKRMNGKSHKRQYERIIIHKDGTEVPVEISTTVTFWQGKQRPLAIVRDITERKRTEEALLASEKKYRDIVELSPDVILTINLKGIITSCNEIIKETTGFSKKEIIGMHISKLSFVKAKDIARYLKLFTALLKGKVPTPFEVEFKHRDGSHRLAEIRVSLMKKNGKIATISAIGTDITERKKAETELLISREQSRKLTAHLQSAREGERTSLAREIHDELGQSLTAMKMDATWIHKSLPLDQEPQLKKTRSLIELLDETIKNVQKISSDLRPSLLDDFGLIAALEWLAKEFQIRTGIGCSASFPPEEISINRENAINLFRIFQETLTNVSRHAQANKVFVSLKEHNGWIILRIKDNGKGITEQNISDSKSFGILGIKERVDYMKGTVKIKGAENKGTTVEVKIPHELH